MSSKVPVLIIEDSPAIGMLLTEFMKKLGYDEVHTTTTGEAGVAVFNTIIHDTESSPLIFLDYNLPDTTANSVMSQILTLKPYTKIIIETANSKDDEKIREVIGLGAYDYVQKPLRFNEIQRIISVLEEEEAFFKKESEQVELLKEAEQKAEDKARDYINFILKSGNQISMIKIKHILGYAEDFVTTYLQKLEKDGKLIQLGEKKEISCNQCDSVRTSQIFFCPNCKSSNFKMGKLIEHYDCGNISEELTYQNDKCPNCKKEIKALGVDYKVMTNHYICNDCKEFFPEISNEYLCLKCENRFKLEDARWQSSINYKINR